MVSLTYICLCIFTNKGLNSPKQPLFLKLGHALTVVLTVGLAVGHIVVRTGEEGGDEEGGGEGGELKSYVPPTFKLNLYISPHSSSLYNFLGG